MTKTPSPLFFNLVDLPFTAERLYFTLRKVLDRQCARESGYMTILCQGKRYRLYIRLRRIGRTFAFYGEPNGQAPHDFEFCRGTLMRQGDAVSGVIDLFGFQSQRAG